MQNYLLIEPNTLLIIILFASIGGLTSVITRISKIDLKEEISRIAVIVPGFSKPFVAAAFAIVVYFILQNKIVGITIGAEAGSGGYGIFAVTSFLCGFSERFAGDIISRVSAERS